ncbi:class I SAM-dependent methyltransferase [Egicoccus sp. AB-alg2]|uniref:class I SAM-dependent methyltransferase n=1 Tax=Egicoccus sp. AB-alg2 TaxID=3242693 RepID=UPI00359E6F76
MSEHGVHTDDSRAHHHDAHDLDAPDCEAHDFDARAATWDDDPAKVERARVVADAIRDAVPLTPTMRLLDYGAGTGLLSERLVDDVGALVLADPSAGMRAVAEAKVASGALPDAQVLDLDLARDAAPAGERFDLVVTMLTLHHVPDVRTVLARFAQLLEPHGWLAVADLVAEDGSFHGTGFEGHHGFDTGELSEWLRAVGFGPVTVTICHQVRKNDRDYPLFLATCRREPAG